jgi:negative regulator of sigma-B (phosphoserine phosphatase)
MRPALGEEVCGDAYLAVEGSISTLAVVDGLGHGRGAAKAASVFIDFFSENASAPLDVMLTNATGPMSKTRGAAVALLRVDGERQTLQFCGIGNIEVKAKSDGRVEPFSMPGIVGRPIRRLNVFTYNVSPGDIFVIYSDGISSRFDLDDYAGMNPEEMARRILVDCGKSHDDATCVVLEMKP